MSEHAHLGTKTPSTQTAGNRLQGAQGFGSRIYVFELMVFQPRVRVENDLKPKLEKPKPENPKLEPVKLNRVSPAGRTAVFGARRRTVQVASWMRCTSARWCRNTSVIRSPDTTTKSRVILSWSRPEMSSYTPDHESFYANFGRCAHATTRYRGVHVREMVQEDVRDQISGHNQKSHLILS